MKHLSLTRILALCLALISLSMLVSGFYGLWSEAKDRAKAVKALNTLRENTDEYRTVLAELSGTGDYKSMEQERASRQEQFDRSAARHRSDLATFTATRAGLKSARELLDEAEKALRTGKTQYETSLQTFEMQAYAFEDAYEQALQAKALLDLALPLLDTAQTAVSDLNMLVFRLRNLGDILDLSGAENEDGGEAMRQSALEAYDTAIALCADTIRITESLQGLSDVEIPVDSLLDALEEAGVSVPEELKTLITGDTGVIDTVPTEELEAMLTELSGSADLYGLLAQLQAGRDAVAAGDWDPVLNEAQFETVRMAYTQNREALGRIADILTSWLPDLNAALTDATEQLSAANEALAQLENARALLEQGRLAITAAGLQIEESEQELKEGREQIDEQEKKLEEQAAQLEEEKLSLDAEEKELLRLTADCEQQKKLEDRERGLRATLRTEEEIRTATDGGEDVLPAADRLISDRAAQIRQAFLRRFPASLLMVLASGFAFLSLPLVFGEKPSRGLLIADALVCLALAAAVTTLLFQAGKGLSYSALTTGGLAVLTLLAALPKVKIA